MSLLDKEEYTIADINELIESKAEEGTYLEFKSASALDPKNESAKTEMSRDVASFANADGGIIIYGIVESKKEHYAQSIDYVDGTKVTKDWIENILGSRIKRMIPKLQIIPIHDNDVEHTVYIIKIPKSPDAPHMSYDHKFYMRRDAKKLEMDEYEVRNEYFRIVKPILNIEDCKFFSVSSNESITICAINATIKNCSKGISKCYKMNVTIHSYKKEFLDEINSKLAKNFNSIFLDSEHLKFSIPAKEFIFPNEIISIGTGEFQIKNDIYTKALLNSQFLFRLYYEGGHEEAFYFPLGNNLFTKEIDIKEIKDRYNFNF